jgi:hypothetical protein
MPTAFQLLLKNHGFRAVAAENENQPEPWAGKLPWQSKLAPDGFGLSGLSFHKANWSSTPKVLQKYVALNFDDFLTDRTWISKFGTTLFVIVWFTDEAVLVAGTETGVDNNHQIAHLRVWPTSESDNKISPKVEEAIALDLKDWAHEAKRRNTALGQK